MLKKETRNVLEHKKKMQFL